MAPGITGVISYVHPSLAIKGQHEFGFNPFLLNLVNKVNAGFISALKALETKLKMCYG